MVDAVKEYAGVDFETILTDEEARKIAIEKNIEIISPLVVCSVISTQSAGITVVSHHAWPSNFIL